MKDLPTYIQIYVFNILRLNFNLVCELFGFIFSQAR